MNQQVKEGPEGICPKCGEECAHTPNEMHGFALDALQEAADWYDRQAHTNYVWQYLPPIVDGDPFKAAFTTQAELLSMGWVDRWAKRSGFKRFVLLKIHPEMNQHKAEYALGAVDNTEERRTPWLIAFLKNNDGLDFEVLPNWEVEQPNRPAFGAKD